MILECICFNKVIHMIRYLIFIRLIPNTEDFGDSPRCC